MKARTCNGMGIEEGHLGQPSHWLFCLFVKFRARSTRAQAGYGNVRRFQLRCERFGETSHVGLCGCVVGVVGNGLECGDGRNVQDIGAVFVTKAVLDEQMGELYKGCNVQLQCPRKCFPFYLGERLIVPGSRIVDEDMKGSNCI